MPTVSSRARRPAGKVLVCGSEDGHEAPGAAGAARGSGLPPVNDCYPEGLRSGEWQWGCRTSWTLLVLISRNTWGTDFALKPRFTWGLLELAQQKGNHWIEFFCYFVSVCESMWNLLSTSCVLFLLCEVKTDSLQTHALLSNRWQKRKTLPQMTNVVVIFVTKQKRMFSIV